MSTRGVVSVIGRDQKGIVARVSTYLAGQNINLEFVSANPTGPIHLGGTRWAAVGDALARILESQGAQHINLESVIPDLAAETSGSAA